MVIRPPLRVLPCCIHHFPVWSNFRILIFPETLIYFILKERHRRHIVRTAPFISKFSVVYGSILFGTIWLRNEPKRQNSLFFAATVYYQMGGQGMISIILTRTGTDKNPVLYLQICPSMRNVISAKTYAWIWKPGRSFENAGSHRQTMSWINQAWMQVSSFNINFNPWLMIISDEYCMWQLI
jgi:hypothetical protein